MFSKTVDLGALRRGASSSVATAAVSIRKKRKRAPTPRALRDANMLADRYRERLAGLDHETLLSYAAELSFTHRHTADVLLAKHSPLPAWRSR